LHKRFVQVMICWLCLALEACSAGQAVAPRPSVTVTPSPTQRLSATPVVVTATLPDTPVFTATPVVTRTVALEPADALRSYLQSVIAERETAEKLLAKDLQQSEDVWAALSRFETSNKTTSEQLALVRTAAQAKMDLSQEERQAIAPALSDAQNVLLAAFGEEMHTPTPKGVAELTQKYNRSIDALLAIQAKAGQPKIGLAYQQLFVVDAGYLSARFIYICAVTGLESRQDKAGLEVAKTWLRTVMDGEARVWAQISTLYGVAAPFAKP